MLHAACSLAGLIPTLGEILFRESLLLNFSDFGVQEAAS